MYQEVVYESISGKDPNEIVIEVYKRSRVLV